MSWWTTTYVGCEHIEMVLGKTNNPNYRCPPDFDKKLSSSFVKTGAVGVCVVGCENCGDIWVDRVVAKLELDGLSEDALIKTGQDEKLLVARPNQ